MTNDSQYALKEWSVTIDSLLAGRQILLLRKGGIHERRDRFSVEHPDFFLFPTHLHQSLHALHPSFQSGFDNHRGTKTSTVILNTYAEVHQLIPIANLDALRPLDSLHTLNWTTVEQRFWYRNRPGLDLLLLRIYRLPVPHQIQNIERYDGCISWVELEESLSTAGAEPVLAKHAFEEQVHKIRRLAGSASQGAPAVRQEHN
jgi:hypothetical protein